MSGERFEVHEHCFVSGPLAQMVDGYKFAHSHADGSIAHGHPETGPSGYTIDKDEWYAATGLKGGGRKRYTKGASGRDLPFIARTREQQTFRVVFVDSGYSAEHARAGVSQDEYDRTREDFRRAASGDVPKARKGTPGDAGAAVANIALTFDMEPVYEVEP